MMLCWSKYILMYECVTVYLQCDGIDIENLFLFLFIYTHLYEVFVIYTQQK